MSTHKYAALALVVAFAACRSQPSTEAAVPQGAGAATDESVQMALTAFEPIPETVTLEDLEITPERVELGKVLFLDPRLSRSGLISCNTCHNLGMAGVDVQETSVGHGWQEGPRNAPTVLNAVFNVAQFWDGRAADLEEQATGPVQASVEMANTPDRVLATLKSMPAYVEYFEAAFPSEDDPVTFENMARAIEAFEATLVTPGSRFDLFLEGDASALTDQEKEGLRLFMETGCAACHNGVNLGGRSYHAFGVHHRPGADVLPPGDLGRYEVTGEESDQYVFKAPTLRNIELTPPYFHSGVVWDLEEAVAIMGMAQLGAHLSEQDAEAITAFLRTLTGKQPEVEYPVLPARTNATPLPDIVVAPPREADGDGADLGETVEGAEAAASASAAAPQQTTAAASSVAAARSRMAMGRMSGMGMGGRGMAMTGSGMGMGRGMGAGECPMMSGASGASNAQASMSGMGSGHGCGMGGGNCRMMTGQSASAACQGGNCAAGANCPGGNCAAQQRGTARNCSGGNCPTATRAMGGAAAGSP